uniref:Conserved oligomeric Golgi complex subunit 7 n=1 Tax=Panagrolaimus sp. ES5 TaxID=591445 RepID=A0AC34GND4_9BILA
MDVVEEEVNSLLLQPHFDAVKSFNGSKLLQKDPSKALQIVDRKLIQVQTELLNRSTAISPNALSESINDLGRTSERLEVKLQSNLRILKLNEGLMSCTNSILEFDTCKSRTDTLVQVLKAKILWSQTFKELQMIEKTERKEKYQSLVTLQQCNDILSQYAVDEERTIAFEKAKDEFLSWDGSATLFAIKDKDFNKLNELEERYRSLNRIEEFQKTFGYFVRNELKAYFEKRGEEDSHLVWQIFDNIFDIWKHVAIMEQYLQSDTSKPFEVVTNSLYEVAKQEWPEVKKHAFLYLVSADDPLKTAREIAKEKQAISAEIENCSDEYFVKLLTNLFEDLNQSFIEAYIQVVKTSLIRVVNAIEMPSKGSKKKCTWLANQLEPLQNAMLDIVHNAYESFDENVSWLATPFEYVFQELHAKMTNNDFFRLKKLESEQQKLVSKNPHEDAENNLSFIIAIGTVMQLYDTVNNTIQNATKKKQKNVESEKMSNRNLLEKLNKKIVQAKAANLAQLIIDPMIQGLNEMKTSSNPVHASAANLPSFSRAPHNYILNVGHGLLSQMNIISSVSGEATFLISVISAAGGKLNAEKADIWLLNCVAETVMRSYCNAVGDVQKLPQHVREQLKADLGYFVDASKDLRLQPTPELTSLKETL